MAGYRLPVEPATLVIDDGPWAGVEVEIDRSAGSLVRSQLIGLLGRPENETDDDAIARGRELFALLETRVVLGWNVERHDGTPIPATTEGFVLVPPDLIATLIGHVLSLSEPTP